MCTSTCNVFSTSIFLQINAHTEYVYLLPEEGANFTMKRCNYTQHKFQEDKRIFV